VTNAKTVCQRRADHWPQRHHRQCMHAVVRSSASRPLSCSNNTVRASAFTACPKIHQLLAIHSNVTPCASTTMLLAVCVLVARASGHDDLFDQHTSLDIALYKDPSQPVDVRTADLLSRMTLDEKVAQLTCVCCVCACVRVCVCLRHSCTVQSLPTLGVCSAQ
jgi:hypothetical protein